MPGITRRIVRPSRLAATHGLTGVTSPLSHIMHLRRRKGHGIHSPYLYHLITDVLFNRHPYYCFDALRLLSPADKHAHRLGRLLFRLAQDAGVTHSLYVGSTGTPDLAYLSMAGAKHRVDALAFSEAGLTLTQALVAGLHTDSIRVIATYNDADLRRQLAAIPTLDLVVINPHLDKTQLRATMNACLETCKHNSLLVVNQPHDKAMVDCWTSACEHPSVTASLDAFRFGLLLFRPDLEKKHYHL